MSPNQNFIINSVPMEPVSRTYQYRKIMKPMLERKRRARINKCLDELKELMASAMQSEGENVSKLEKADILELTVRHLHSLREKNSLHSRQDQNKIESFWEGFRKCASEVSQYLSKFDQKIGSDLLGYINRCAQVDSGNSTAITIRSDAYLFGTYRYQDFLLKQGVDVVDLRQNVNHFGQIPARTGKNENAVSVNVWRPW